MTTTDDVTRAVSAYRVALAVAKEEARAELESLVADKTVTDRMELSKILHAAHADGVPIATLKSLTKAYNNAAYWVPLWEAFDPGVKVDLRRSGTAAEEQSVLRRAHEPGDWWVTYEGEEYLFTNVQYDSENASIIFDADPTNEEVYRFGWITLLNYYKEGGS